MLEPVRFIVLIPHQDSDGLLRDYKGRLFARGVIGAYSFPVVAPLSIVSQPFTKEELKILARSLRELSAAKGRNGKITAGELQSLPFPEETSLSLFGPRLDLPIPDFSQDSLKYRFPSLLLCAGLIKAEDQAVIQKDNLPATPLFSFRAGMVANLILRPLCSGEAGYSFEWKIGVPVWLPAYKQEEIDS